MGMVNDKNVINFGNNSSKFENTTQLNSFVLKSKIDGMNNIEYLNNYLATVIDEFLMDKRMRSIDTYRNYLCDINRVANDFFGYEDFKYLTKNDLESLTVDKLIKYRNELYKAEDEYGERKYSNSTINRRMSSFKSLMKYLKARGSIKYPVSDMMTLLKALPNESVEIDVLSTEDAERCMEFFKKQENGLPVYLAAKFSVDTGLRAMEILTLHWNQFYLEENHVMVKSKGKIKGKGNKDWKKEISYELYNEILQLKKEGIEKVFNISYSFIAKMMSKAINELGLTDKDYSFHSFRKRAGTNVYDQTGDILAVKDFLNHENVNTTQKYVKTKEYGMLGIYSQGEKIDKNLYKNVDKELLLEAIEELDKGFVHILNIKLNEKMKK